MLMNKKLEYLTPEVDVFTVQTEGVICQSVITDGDFGSPGLPGGTIPTDDLGIFGIL